MKVLLAVDGSECALRAVDHVVRNIHNFGGNPELHLLHVQFQLPGRITDAVDRNVLHDYYEEESFKALQAARIALSRAGITFKEFHLIGQKAGVTVGHYATRGEFSLVVMAHGQGALSSLVLGSVVREVLANCATPTLVIR